MSSGDLGSAVFTIAGNSSPFVRALQTSETSARSFTRRLSFIETAGVRTFGILGASVGHFNRALNIGMAGLLGFTGAAGIGMGALGVASVKFAADATETENKFNVLFGDSADRSKDALYGFGREVGRSKQELLDMAANFKGVTRQFDVSDDVASSLAVRLSKLAVDLGSFNNVADSEAAERLYSGLIGNHEALRRLNVFISEAAIKTELLKMGFKGNAEAATDQQKQLARLAIVLRDTAPAQGDAARTAHEFSNQMKAMWATLKDAGDELGSAIIPSLQVLLDSFLGMMSVIRGNADGIQEWGNAFAVVLKDIMSWVESTGSAIMNYDLIWASLWLSIREGVLPVTNAIANFAAGAIGRMEWLAANWSTMWSNLLRTMSENLIGFAQETMHNLKGLYDFIASGGKNASFKFEATANLANMDVMKGTTKYAAPDKIEMDYASERKKLEDEYLRRANKLNGSLDKKAEAVEGSASGKLPGLGRASAKTEKKIQVEIVNSEQVFRKNLMDALKDKQNQKAVQVAQSQLEEQKVARQEAKQNTTQIVEAVKERPPFGLW
jgi:hypothetical protein